MERWRICSECGSDNIHCDIGVNLNTPERQRSNYVVLKPNVLIADLVTVDLFVCGDCGNVRAFISDARALHIINKEWPRADETI